LPAPLRCGGEMLGTTGRIHGLMLDPCRRRTHPRAP